MKNTFTPTHHINISTTDIKSLRHRHRMTEGKMEAATTDGTKTGSTYSAWSSIAIRYVSEVPKEDFERDTSTSQEWPRRRRNRRTGWITCCWCGKHGHRGRDCKNRFKGERSGPKDL
ncbi:hypothetical protein ARMGADRAFT_349310 [Armillaria gallica]|uniref:CCHC-type domain-containing protein n=1 Tax=Armillaria gallica TaxID=47427 RepID=A0A2H3D5G7_ARMGA|nr:hypothetical protein ARMGADRAFT_349310 [Armillaria gallica]